MIKLPERKIKKASEMMNMNMEQQKLYCCEINAWNACVDEYEVLNATAQPVSDGWVKCSERLPPVGKRVLIPTSGLGEAIEAVRFESNKFNRFGIEIIADYWMPLPAAPGGQDD